MKRALFFQPLAIRRFSPGFFWGLLICLSLSLGSTNPAQAADVADPLVQKLQQTWKNAFTDNGHLNAGLVVVHNDHVSTQVLGQVKEDTSLPLLRLNEVFVSQALLAELAAGKAKLEDPVNYYLSGFRMQEPQGEITLRHLLTHSSGLPLRQKGLFVTEAKHSLSVQDLLNQDLQPSVLAPDTGITSPSMAEPLAALVLSQLSQKPLKDFLPSYAQKTYGIELKLAQSASEIPAFDHQGGLIQAYTATTPELYGYTATLPEMGQVLKTFQAHPMGSRWRLSLLSSRYFNQNSSHDYFHLDSDWLGYRQHLVIVPAQNLAYYSFGNQAESRTAGKPLNQQLLAQLFPATASSPPSSTTSGGAAELSGTYVLQGRNTHSLLKALQLFDFMQVQANADGLRSKHSGQSASWRLFSKPNQASAQVWVNPAGEALLHTPSGQGPQILRQLWGDNASWVRVSGWQNPYLHWGLAALFGLFFVTMFWRGLKQVYLYEPELKLPPPASKDEAEAPKESGDETEAAKPDKASWDLPLLGTLGSGLALTFMLGIYPILMLDHRVGNALSVSVRNQPSGWLLAWLVMPLIALVSNLMLLALLGVEWKDRPWAKGERWHYLAQGILLLCWCTWLAQWNLLGFRF